MAIGAHTHSHPILATLSERAARNDIAGQRRRLEDLLQAPVNLFAYPNGKAGHDYGPRHMDIVRSLGFSAAVATDWGVARPGPAWTRTSCPASRRGIEDAWRFCGACAGIRCERARMGPEPLFQHQQYHTMVPW